MYYPYLPLFPIFTAFLESQLVWGGVIYGFLKNGLILGNRGNAGFKHRSV